MSQDQGQLGIAFQQTGTDVSNAGTGTGIARSQTSARKRTSTQTKPEFVKLHPATFVTDSPRSSAQEMQIAGGVDQHATTGWLTSFSHSIPLVICHRVNVVSILQHRSLGGSSAPFTNLGVVLSNDITEAAVEKDWLPTTTRENDLLLRCLYKYVRCCGLASSSRRFPN